MQRLLGSDEVDHANSVATQVTAELADSLMTRGLSAQVSTHTSTCLYKHMSVHTSTDGGTPRITTLKEALCMSKHMDTHANLHASTHGSTHVYTQVSSQMKEHIKNNDPDEAI